MSQIARSLPRSGMTSCNVIVARLCAITQAVMVAASFSRRSSSFGDETGPPRLHWAAVRTTAEYGKGDPT